MIRFVVFLGVLVFLGGQSALGAGNQGRIGQNGTHIVAQPAQGGSFFVGSIDVMAVIKVGELYYFMTWALY
jgi:hypothetical protein